MGDAVSSDTYTPKQRTRYRQRLMGDLEVFDRLLQTADFIDEGTIGLELELNLVDDQMQPSRSSEAVLAELSDEYQSEIGSFNVELNLPPHTINGTGLSQLQDELTARLDAVKDAASKADASVTMIGTLP